jgi:hypothetical protein
MIKKHGHAIKLSSKFGRSIKFARRLVKRQRRRFETIASLTVTGGIFKGNAVASNARAVMDSLFPLLGESP